MVPSEARQLGESLSEDGQAHDIAPPHVWCEFPTDLHRCYLGFGRSRCLAIESLTLLRAHSSAADAICAAWGAFSCNFTNARAINSRSKLRHPESSHSLPKVPRFLLGSVTRRGLCEYMSAFGRIVPTAQAGSGTSQQCKIFSARLNPSDNSAELAGSLPLQRASNLTFPECY